MSSAQPFIEVRRLSKAYRRGGQIVPVLTDITLDIMSGEFTALMGPSGSGKSTLLNLIAGIDKPDSGELRVGSLDITRLSESELADWRAGHIGFIFQFYNLMPVLTAFENVELPLMLTPLARAERRERVDLTLSMVGLEDREAHYPSELSGGQQQRVAGARALVRRPDVVFADEPTGNLDTRAGTELLEFLQAAARDHGQTIVMVTHDPRAASYAERVVFLRDGSIVDELAAPTAESVFDRLKSLEA